MKFSHKKSILLASLISVLWMGVGCERVLDVNVDPNRTTSNPPNLILTAAQAQLGFSMGADLNRFTALFSQQIAAQNGRQTEAWDVYVIQPTEVNNLWRGNMYAGLFADLEEIIKKGNDIHPAYLGISKAMKAFGFALVTDLWGDVPFTEALKGVENTQPAPDRSQNIYPALISLLDEAIADLRKTSPLVAPANDDYIYAGNTQRWIRFANTLKLRLFLHMANAQGFNVNTVQQFIANTPATDFMTANADNFRMRFDNVAQRQNPIHQFIVLRTDDICTSSTMINLMNGKADPRRATYFTPSPFSPAALASPPTGNTGYVGLRNGTAGGGVNNNLSRIHTFIRGAVTSTTIPPGPALGVAGLAYTGNAPLNMLTFAEYNFIRAEMALRYGAAGNAEELYRAGIQASMADAGVPAAQITAYLATPAGTLGTGTDALQKLIEEKYVANFLVAIEPWNDWRRTGFPTLQPIPATANPGNNGRFPRALPYPQQEVDANPKLKEIQRNNLSERPVYWDTRTTGQQ
ncbi:MAG: SusD/RagB family nutrient-binding outer membrane lipoprotein [Runella sp.]